MGKIGGGTAISCALALAACSTHSSNTVEPTDARPLEMLRVELDQILADPAFHNAHWGVMIQSVETGQVFYRRNERKLFMPASNMKLVTGAVALSRLGAQHRFNTRIAACGVIAEDGVLQGDLMIIGGGDPSISARFNGGDELRVLRSWVDSLLGRGIQRITGNVVGDDDLFDDVHIGPGWAWDYLDAAYAAEIGALLFNESAVRFTVRPGDSVGSAASVRAQPETDYLDVHYAVTSTEDSTGASIRSSRRPFSNEAEVSGVIWIGADSVVQYIAPHDPTMYFVTVLRETLESRGIVVDGQPLDRDNMDQECTERTTLFVHESATLAEILKPFLKESQNQIGEMLLRYLGAVDADQGSINAGRRAVSSTLTAWGIPDDSYGYYDGSGLSRYNYLAPEAVVRLLRVMARHPESDVFYDALPVAGVDGTLERRMKGTRAENNARAKTGFISNARALSGYVRTADGGMLAFSVIANNFDTPVRPVEYVQDLIVERLANLSLR
jgi:D-alanyl-D-alanine carboxypeptidase/D-alanyl-D-alanine-endopeptidase (penicillin-binding protein 4)